MRLYRQYLTENECYITGQKHTVKGIMVHSTGANNTYLKRYVQPDDGRLGVNQYNNSMNRFRPDGRQVCPHAFIGRLNDGSIATYQTLPWDIAGWHSGGGKNGNANFMGYIGFEICEDDLTDTSYFNDVYREAAELCAYLCRLYGLDPESAVICHSEGYQKGIASNHSDVMHWFPRHGKTMDTFRDEVKAIIAGQTDGEAKPAPDPTPAPAPDEPTAGGTVYTVKYGDTLSGIAKQYGTTYQKLAEYNGIADPALIRVGQKINIPGAAPAPAPTPSPAVKTVDELAKEVIRGQWGSGADRKNRLTAAGYDYAAVQSRVNKMING